MFSTIAFPQGVGGLVVNYYFSTGGNPAIS
jgi:hypothetical protein